MHNGFAIVLAWPETLCKQAGGWYDPLLEFFNLNKNGYYKIGHAAIVLVDENTGVCQYFDFGRYHAPHGFGRVRSAFTDHDLKINTNAEIFENQIENLNDILQELFENKSTHGTGPINATLTRINFNAALQKVLNMQAQEFIEYGPLLPNGTNCSRFVNTAVLAGKPSFSEQLALTFPLTISPSPMWNLTATGSQTFIVGAPETQEEIAMNEPQMIFVR